MANRGRKPTPQSTENPEAPDCPEWLAPEARAEWGRVVNLLMERGTLTPGDRACLAAFCQTWADYRTACETVERDGTVAIAESGAPYQHPAVGMKNTAVKNLRAYASELGLTPASRGVKAGTISPGGIGGSDAAAFLFGGGNGGKR